MLPSKFGLALMDRANAATMAARPAFSEQCLDATPYADEAFPYFQPGSTSHRRRHSLLAAAACLALAAVPLAFPEAAGLDRQREQDATGGRIAAAAARDEKPALAGRGAGAKATAGDSACASQAEAGQASAEKAGAAPDTDSATRCGSTASGRGAACRAGTAGACRARGGYGASGHVGNGGGGTRTATGCRPPVAG